MANKYNYYSRWYVGWERRSVCMESLPHVFIYIGVKCLEWSQLDVCIDNSLNSPYRLLPPGFAYIILHLSKRLYCFRPFHLSKSLISFKIHLIISSLGELPSLKRPVLPSLRWPPLSVSFISFVWFWFWSYLLIQSVTYLFKSLHTSV